MNSVEYFKRKRGLLGAFMFYALNLLFLLILTGLIASILTIIAGENLWISEIGTLVSGIGSVTLSLVVLKNKNRKEAVYLFLAGVSFLVGVFQGALIALLIPTAFTILDTKA